MWFSVNLGGSTEEKETKEGEEQDGQKEAEESKDEGKTEGETEGEQQDGEKAAEAEGEQKEEQKDEQTNEEGEKSWRNPHCAVLSDLACDLVWPLTFLHSQPLPLKTRLISFIFLKL